MDVCTFSVIVKRFSTNTIFWPLRSALVVDPGAGSHAWIPNRAASRVKLAGVL